MKEINLSPNAKKVLEKRYLKKDVNGNPVESPEDMFERVAKTIAGAEIIFDKNADRKVYEEKFYDLMANREFMPNSPTLMNAGRDLGQLSACFVLPVEDSMEGIFDAIKNAALIHKSGGGTGMSFSRLRPKGAAVMSTGGVASGPISFMKVFNSATEAVKQGGTRRGANMGMLRVDHPDIMEFIKCKKENQDITNFNISVGITEKFMEAFRKDEEYSLIDPHTKEEVSRLKAKDVFELIVDMAWKNGEPGIVFIDKMNQDNPTPNEGEIESTNPCFHPDTLITTEMGLETISDLYERVKDEKVELAVDERVSNDKVKVNGREYYKNGINWHKASVFPTGKKEIIKVILRNGQELKVTPEHKLFTTDGWKEAAKLKDGDKVLIQSGAGKWNNTDEIGNQLGLLLGWITGDGWLTKDGKVIGLVFGKEEEYLAPKFQEIIEDNGGGERKINQRENGTLQLLFKRKELVDKLKELGLEAKKASEKRVPKSIFTSTEDTVSSYLKGLFGADGTVCFTDENHRDARLTSSSEHLLKDVQLLLLNLGVFSNIYNRTKKNPSKFTYTTRDGEEKEYVGGDYFELIINGDDLVTFKEKVGFIVKNKQEKLDSIARESRKKTKFYSEVAKIEEKGEEVMVYDVTEETTHSLIAQGIVAHNCGEQPLLPYESCNLGSINLTKITKNVGGKVEIDYEKLKEIVHLSVRFLDNVIEVNKYPLKKIEEKTLANRKIGLGVMGFADLLIMLEIPYNSDNAVELAKKLMKFIKDESYKASAKLAEERGEFPNFKGSIHDKEGNSPLRNATLTTIAPTGTISIIAGASSGIEPLFAVSYERHVMDNERLIEVHPYFETTAREKGFYSKELMEDIANKGSVKYFDEIPDKYKNIYVTSHDILPKWHIKIQGAFQQYTDNAVSKTVNFANSATRNDVKEVYLSAYNLGCKGVTIYRDGSRDEQVLNIGSKDKNQEEKQKIKLRPRQRPEITVGNTEKTVMGCGNLYITVNSDKDGICEVFTNLGRGGGCPSQSEATSRLISMALRAGVEVEALIEQLKGIRCLSTIRRKGIKVLSCPDAIGRAIERSIGKKIVPNGTAEELVQDEITATKENNNDINSNVFSMEECPDCNGKIEHEGGCVVCRKCGFSKCG